MPISVELRAKIDALEDERLKAEIIEVLEGPAKKHASDEAIFETILAGYTIATEQQAQLRRWQDYEVAAFVQYFKERKPEDYVEFLRQEKEFNEIESELGWKVRRLIWEWMPDLNSADCRGLYRKFRQFVRTLLA
ncbi:hypothetical protein [Lysobacter sp. CA199]|uniref:hypothetical protein n=1 Tax=Lysobacter sp. CA199 TaxID=3455608 RepID=UPI003F8D388E